jgi:hypothetical protein
MSPTTCSGSALWCVALVIGALSVWAEWGWTGEVPAAQPQPQTVTPVPPEAAPIDDQKLDRYADAYLSIEAIHTKTAARLAGAKDAASINKIKAQAEGDILQSIERSGLTLDEFNQIAELEKVDGNLRKRIADRVERRRQ